MYLLYLRFEEEIENVIPISELPRYTNSGLSIDLATNLKVIDDFTGAFNNKTEFLEEINRDYTEFSSSKSDKNFTFMLKKDGNKYLSDAFFGEDYKLLNWAGLKAWIEKNRNNPDYITRLNNWLLSKIQRMESSNRAKELIVEYKRILTCLTDGKDIESINLSYEEIRKIAVFICERLHPLAKKQPINEDNLKQSDANNKIFTKLHVEEKAA